jgi:hypothetical protein
MKPVYMINGFLESGKSEFINYTLSQPYFQSKGPTLLLLCEEGEVEFEETLLKKTNTILIPIEKEENFNPAFLLELESKYKPERIIVEYNGMWNFKNMKLPWHWSIEQQITTIDASTFTTYFSNMRSLVAEMIKKSEMIIFNRCDDVKDLSNLKRNVKAINQKAEIIFEDSNGEINAIMEEDLPYDLKKDIIELDGMAYGVWYLDMLENLHRYVGKTVRFKALVAKPSKIPTGFFVPGRMAMTCCADDMVYLGFVCKYEKTEDLKEKDWVELTARIQEEYFADYNGNGPVLHGISLEKTKAPKEEIINFA